MTQERTRKQYSPSQIATHLSQWQQSSQSKRDYCTAHQLNYHTFVSWSNNHKQKRRRNKIPAPAPNFIPLTLSPPQEPAPPLAELILEASGQRRILFYTTASLSHLPHLMG